MTLNEFQDFVCKMRDREAYASMLKELLDLEPSKEQLRRRLAEKMAEVAAMADLAGIELESLAGAVF